MTGMDKLEFRCVEHPACNNEIWSICVKSEPYGFFPPPGPIRVKRSKARSLPFCAIIIICLVLTATNQDDVTLDSYSQNAASFLNFCCLPSYWPQTQLNPVLSKSRLWTKNQDRLGGLICAPREMLLVQTFCET